MCNRELTEFLAELTEFAGKLSEFSLPKQYSRNSLLPVSEYLEGGGNISCCPFLVPVSGLRFVRTMVHSLHLILPFLFISLVRLLCLGHFFYIHLFGNN